MTARQRDRISGVAGGDEVPGGDGAKDVGALLTSLIRVCVRVLNAGNIGGARYRARRQLPEEKVNLMESRGAESFEVGIVAVTSGG